VLQRLINVDKLKTIVAEMLSLGENDGDTDKERALNYMLHHNFAVYSRSCEIMFEGSANNSDLPSARLSNIQVLTQMSDQRVIAKVVFDYQNNNGGAGQSWYSAVDVTDQYPFLLVPTIFLKVFSKWFKSENPTSAQTWVT
jgi:hypothetical protein